MLFLLFQLGRDRYAMKAAQVAEVVPLVNFKKIPRAPKGVAGLFNFRGTFVPVVDLGEVSLGRPSQLRLSTRIILVNYQVDPEKTRLLGLIAEKTTETINLDESAFVSGGIDVVDAPYLGPVTQSPRGLIQSIEVNKLLPESLRNLLFRETAQ